MCCLGVRTTPTPKSAYSSNCRVTAAPCVPALQTLAAPCVPTLQTMEPQLLWDSLALGPKAHCACACTVNHGSAATPWIPMLQTSEVNTTASQPVPWSPETLSLHLCLHLRPQLLSHSQTLVPGTPEPLLQQICLHLHPRSHSALHTCTLDAGSEAIT